MNKVMCDDLIKELDIVLNFEKDNDSVHSSKLQTYFNNSDDNDDLFASIIKDNASSNNLIEAKWFDSKNIKSSVDMKNQEESKKSVRFSDSIDGEIENHYKYANQSKFETSFGSAWLTSENTKIILSKIMCKEINVNQVNKASLARPQLYTDQNSRIPDPIFSLLTDNYGNNIAIELRQIPSLETCKETEEGVISLISRGWIRPAIDLTSKILFNMGFSYSKSQLIDSTTSFTFESGRIWCIRFTLLARMKLYAILEAELSGFQNLDCPNLYHEFYDDTVTASKGSIIPFSMRLVYAELPCYFNRFGEALNRLYYLLAIIRRILINLQSGYSEDGTKFIIEQISKKSTIDLWHKREIRALLSVLRVLIVSKDYQSAIEILFEVIKRSTNSINESLYRLLARIYLHLGDLDNASFYFNESIKVFIEDDTLQFNDKDRVIASKLSLHNGYLNMTRGNFEDSKKCFQDYLEYDADNIMVLNNFAVCCLYLKKVQEAISVFEKLLDNGIRLDALIFNLSILYELQTTQVKNKKLKIVKLLSKTVGDDFSINSFKLSNSD